MMAGIVSQLRGELHQQTPTWGLLLPALFLTLPLFGCNDVATRSAIDETSQKARVGVEEVEHTPVEQKRYDPLVVSDKVWSGATAVRMHRGVPLPDRLEGARGVTLVSSTPMALDEVAKAISSQTGIPVYLADAGFGVKPGLGVQNNSSSSSGNGMMVAYEGPLSGLLERVAANFGVSWRFDGASITVKRFETRVFTIEALPGTQSIQEGMQDDSSSGGSGGGSSGGSSSSTNTITQNSKFAIDFKYWDEIGQVVTSMLGGTGAVVVAPSLGTITVTTTPEIMRLVADYLADENQKMSRQIAVNVEVYSVNLNQGMDFSLAFTAALKFLSHNAITGVTAPSEAGSFSGGGSMAVAILNSQSVGSATDIFKALSAIGDTTKVAKFPVVTLNNRPVSRRIGEDIGYLASSSSTASATAGSGATVTLSPGTVHQGFSMQMTPRLLDDGRILLQYSLSIVDLVQMTCFSSAGIDCTGVTASSAAQLASSSSTAIQVPTTSNRIFVQQSVLRSGSTLIIGGVEENDAVQNSQGVGDAYNFLFGGGESSARTHTMVFFALTPRVLESPRAEQD